MNSEEAENMQAIQSIEKRNEIRKQEAKGLENFEITLRDLEPESVEREKKEEEREAKNALQKRKMEWKVPL